MSGTLNSAVAYSDRRQVQVALLSYLLFYLFLCFHSFHSACHLPSTFIDLFRSFLVFVQFSYAFSARLFIFLNSFQCSSRESSSSRMRVIYHNWSATKQRPHPQSVAEISHHSVLSGDRIRQCETSSGSRHKDTDQCL